MTSVLKTQEEHKMLILLQLQESFKAIESVHDTWKALCSRGQACARNVGKLSDQLKACQNVNFNLMPSKFPLNIKEKVRRKIQDALAEELIDMNEILNDLKDSHNVIRNQCYQAEKIYEENKHLDFHVVISPTESHPPISEMMKYIDILQSLHANEYLKRKFSLAQFFDDNMASDLKECWQECSWENSTTDFEPLVQAFLLENLKG